VVVGGNVLVAAGAAVVEGAEVAVRSSPAEEPPQAESDVAANKASTPTYIAFIGAGV
jgi:hypothetical protein